LKPGGLRSIADAALIGLVFPSGTIAGYFLGSGFDRLAGTGPWGSYAGAIFGIAAAFVALFRLAARPDDGQPPGGSNGR